MDKKSEPFPVLPNIRISKKLGSGGMSDVYLGIQEKLHRQVAVKVLKPELVKKPEFAERFLVEARTAAKLIHPNILTIFDVNDHGEYNYIVMELLEDSLYERIQNNPRKKLPVEYVLEVSLQLTDALIYAHGEGVIHRDIKSDNIMFRRDATPVLVDFGIARAIRSTDRITKVGTIVGTPYYMSPEQCQGETLDGRSDIYSLGIVIHEMLTGEVPYQARNATGVLIKHIRGRIPVLPRSFKHFQPLMDRMLAKRREERFADGGELKEWLSALQQDGHLGRCLDISETVISGRLRSTEPILDRESTAREWVFRSREPELPEDTREGEEGERPRGKRVRVVFLLLFILFLAGGIYYHIYRPQLAPRLEHWIRRVILPPGNRDLSPDVIRQITTPREPFHPDPLPVPPPSGVFSLAAGTEPGDEPAGNFRLSLPENRWDFADLPPMLKRLERYQARVVTVRQNLRDRQFDQARENIRAARRLFPSPELDTLLAETEYQERETALDRQEEKEAEKLQKEREQADRQAFQQARQADTLAAYRQYRQRFPGGKYRTAAERKIEELKNQKIRDLEHRLSLRSIRFFQSDRPGGSGEEVTFQDRFQRGQTRFIVTQIEFQNNLFTVAPQTTPIRIVYSLKGERDFSFEVIGEVFQDPAAETITYRRGGGFASGNWKTGEYRVEVYTGDFLKGSGSFAITE